MHATYLFLEKKGFILPYTSTTITIHHLRMSVPELKGGNRGRKFMKQRRNAVYWLAPPCSLICFSIQLKTTFPDVAPLVVVWTLPHQTLIKKVVPQVWLQACLMEAFSQLRFPLSRYVQIYVKHTCQS